MPGGRQFAVAAHPAGATVTVDPEPPMYLDAPGTSSERLLGGLSYLYSRFIKRGRWEVEIIPYPNGDSPRWRERVADRNAAEARVGQLAAALSKG
ncbi:MAG TPA: hypothetical protein VKJ07_14005, partial [Mycobacteriales bacterium]|nr:hypothetical protein [Mycobacteriales bacterium]